MTTGPPGWSVHPMRSTILVFTALFLASTVVTNLSFLAASRVGPGVHFGVPRALGIPFGFALLLAIAWFGLVKWGPSLGRTGVLVAVGLPILGVVVLNLFVGSVGLTVKVIPVYTTWVLGVVAGWFCATRGNPVWPVGFALLSLLMVPGPYDAWADRVDFGHWPGQLKPAEMASFSFTDDQGRTVDNESLAGQVVLLEFWFSTCPSCWKKFPELQRVHERYADTQGVAVFAVNRGDEPDEDVFDVTRRKGFSFPVLAGTPESMDQLEVTSYPTVMLVDRRGALVFKGDIDGAERELAKMVAAAPPA